MNQHLTELSDEEIAAAQQTLAPTKVETIEPTETPIATPVVENTAPADSSLKTTEAKTEEKVDAPVVETKTEETPVPTKSFEEYLAERSQGKYKKWEELEQDLNAPREEFANEKVKHWNELEKKGIKLDKEFFELQSLNLDDDEMNPEDVILQAMRRKDDYSGLSERTLKRELDKKYNYSQWIEKFDEDGRLKEGEELSEDDLANQEFMMRDAQKDLEWLRSYKKERTFIPEPNQEELQQQAESKRLAIANFEKFVDEELFTKITNLSTEIKIDDNTTEVFEFKPSEADRKEMTGFMKLLPLGTNILVNRFAEKQPDGSLKINDQRVYQMLLRDKTYDEAVKNAYKDGMAQGAKKFVKEEVKNVSFQAADHNSGNQVPQTEAEALALAMKNSGKKFI